MNANYKHIVEQAFNQTNSIANEGKLATYIPELANVDPEIFGVHLTKMDGSNFGMGNHLQKLSIQSIAKVLALTLAYKIQGEKIWERVHVEPSGTKFDSLSLFLIFIFI